MKIASAMIPVASVSEQIVAAEIASSKKQPTIAIETNIVSVAGVISYVEFGSTTPVPDASITDANLYNRLGQITQRMSDQTQQFTSVMKAMTLQADPATQTTSLDIII